MKKDRKILLFYGLYFMFFFAEAISFCLLISFLTSLDYSPTERSLFLALNAVVGIAGQVFFGYLCDRNKKIRPYLFLVIALYTVVTFANYSYGEKNYFYHLVTVMLLGGLMKVGNSLLDSLTLESGEKYMAAFGSIRAFGSIGWAIGAKVAGLLVGFGGYRALRYGFVASTVTICLILYRIADVHKKSRVRATFRDVRGLLSNKRYLYITVMLLFLCLICYSRNLVIVDKIHMLKGTENEVSTFEAVAATMELPLFFFGYKLMNKIGIKKMTLLSGVALIGEFLWFALAKTPVQIIWALLFQTFTFPVITLISKYLIDSETPDHLKTSGQQVATSIYSGGANLLNPIITGLAEDTVGINATIFAITAFTIVPIFMCLKYHPRQNA